MGICGSLSDCCSSVGFVKFNDDSDEIDEKQLLENIKSTDAHELLEDLHSYLKKCEGNAELLECMRDKLCVDGCVLIVTIKIPDQPIGGLPQSTEAHAALKIFHQVLMKLRVFDVPIIVNDEDDSKGDNRVKLVKAEDGKFFCFAKTATLAFLAALKIRGIISNEFAGIAEIQGIGIEQGSVILMESDYYGQPVNIASKLGEDIAGNGDFIISSTVKENLENNRFQDFEPDTASVSGVDFNFFRVICSSRETDIDLGRSLGYNATVEVGKTISGELPNLQDLLEQTHCSSSSGAIEDIYTVLSALQKKSPINDEVDPNHISTFDSLRKTCTSDITVFVTDMSGFTRISNQYGILHYINMIYACREIWVKRLAEVGGTILKYDADDVIGKFEDPDIGKIKSCLQNVFADIAEYNTTREKDYQIRMGCGLSYGPVMIIGHNIYGEVFDEAFDLGEEESDVGQILVTDSFRKFFEKDISDSITEDPNTDKEDTSIKWDWKIDGQPIFQEED